MCVVTHKLERPSAHALSFPQGKQHRRRQLWSAHACSQGPHRPQAAAPRVSSMRARIALGNREVVYGWAESYRRKREGECLRDDGWVLA
jgi:hypothetical protein